MSRKSFHELVTRLLALDARTLALPLARLSPSLLEINSQYFTHCTRRVSAAMDERTCDADTTHAVNL